MLVDTNILIDLALNRQPHAADAEDLLNRLAQEPGRASVAWHSISNIHYIVAHPEGDRNARAFIAGLARFLTVVPTGTDALQYALSLPMRDFEDAMQVAAADAGGASHIITRNIRDFVNSPVPAITPRQAIEMLGAGRGGGRRRR